MIRFNEPRAIIELIIFITLCNKLIFKNSIINYNNVIHMINSIIDNLCETKFDE